MRFTLAWWTVVIEEGRQNGGWERGDMPKVLSLCHLILTGETHWFLSGDSAAGLRSNYSNQLSKSYGFADDDSQGKFHFFHVYTDISQ